MVVKFVAGIETHWALFTSVFFHGVGPQVLVELILIVESLVTVLTLEGFVEVTGEDVRLVISEEWRCRLLAISKIIIIS